MRRMRDLAKKKNMLINEGCMEIRGSERKIGREGMNETKTREKEEEWPP